MWSLRLDEWERSLELDEDERGLGFKRMGKGAWDLENERCLGFRGWREEPVIRQRDRSQGSGE